jgi:LCP family protein required for cell wall assembly
MSNQSSVKSHVLRAAVVVVTSVVVVLGWTGFRVWASWHSLDRFPFDAADARLSLAAHLGTATHPGDTEDETPVETRPAPEPGDPVLAFLIVGSDQRSVADLSRRADVILMFVLPPDDVAPVLFSIPRDLYIPNPCTGGLSRVNANLNGCGDLATGPEQLAVAVEDFTGIGVDHFAVFDFDGFRAVIDRVGGVDICVQHEVRDLNSQLSLPAGCSRAMGEQALAWVRSRRTQELVGGTWRTMPGVNDLTRNHRQQELVLQAMVRLKEFRTVNELASLVDELAGAFVLDEGLRLSQAVALAWDLRGRDVENIIRFDIPTAGMVSPAGESVLRPLEPFELTLRAAHPDADSILTP